jgi:hypothetical protein
MGNYLDDDKDGNVLIAISNFLFDEKEERMIQFIKNK